MRYQIAHGRAAGHSCRRHSHGAADDVGRGLAARLKDMYPATKIERVQTLGNSGSL